MDSQQFSILGVNFSDERTWRGFHQFLSRGKYRHDHPEGDTDNRGQVLHDHTDRRDGLQLHAFSQQRLREREWWQWFGEHFRL